MKVYCLSILWLLIYHVAAADSFTLELSLGSSWSFSDALSVDNAEQLSDFQTRPFSDSPYYRWRIGYQREKYRFSAELVHHKVYVKTPPDPFSSLEISHGYNLLFFSAGYELRGITFYGGAGPVIVHPEGTIQGSGISSGYRWTGPALQLAVSKEIDLSRRFFINVEGKFTVARSDFFLDNRRLSVPNRAVHLLGGVGIRITD